MAMLAVYCDDSGTDPKTRVAVIAGYVGKVSQWELFAKDWKKVLRAFGVTMMHRSELESFGGEFLQSRGWNPKRRTLFVQRLQSIIRRRTLFPVGSSIIKKDFEAIVPDELKKLYGGVYGWCVRDCIVMVSKWCDKPCRRHTDPIQWVFEAGTIGEEQVNEQLKSLYNDPQARQESHIGGWSFIGKECVPLQSADVIAFEVRKHVENQIVDRGERAVRLSMQHLMGSDHGRYLKHWNSERLTQWVECWKKTRQS